MTDFDESPLLGDILKASSRTEPAGAAPAKAARPRVDLEDLLQLPDQGWRAFLAEAAPDDLVVICSSITPAWRARVFETLDQVSSDWLRSNIAALDEVAPVLRQESRERLLAVAKRLQREGTLTLPEPQVEPAAPVASRDQVAPALKPATTGKPPAKVQAPPPVVSIGFDAAPAPAAPQPRPAGRTTATVTVVSAHAVGPAATPDGDIDALFAELKRLRAHTGLDALSTLATEVSDPFLRTGLSLVASGIPIAELERQLDQALARQATAYLDQLKLMRIRLIDLASGG